MKIVGYKKFEYIMGKIDPPKENDATYAKWYAENQKVKSVADLNVAGDNEALSATAYCKSSLGKGIMFKKGNNIEFKGYTDADWAVCSRIFHVCRRKSGHLAKMDPRGSSAHACGYEGIGPSGAAGGDSDAVLCSVAQQIMAKIARNSRKLGGPSAGHSSSIEKETSGRTVDGGIGLRSLVLPFCKSCSQFILREVLLRGREMSMFSACRPSSTSLQFKTQKSSGWSYPVCPGVNPTGQDHTRCGPDHKPRVLKFAKGGFPRIQVFCNSSSSPGGGPPLGENESRSILDAFFLGRALAEALNERIESTVGEFLSAIGRLQAEQQKQVHDFQEEVLDRAKRAKERAAREALGAQGLVPKSSTTVIASRTPKSNGAPLATSPSATNASTPTKGTSSSSDPSAPNFDPNATDPYLDVSNGD
ncbi:uncharacterized protein LOC131155981 [Malania oleifera]|uniref:uncharacterized protein LOC131155981 n=1 Tax=Malania oleifera TaxID=397392 RepID=UPI0025AE0308|nr:uncharacterized protein LOC131155981 [Malania oleifera]